MCAAIGPGEPGVTATPATLEVIRRLEGAHGPLAIFQSGGCCEGTSPICLRAGELPPSPHDLHVGEIGGVPVYIDAEQYERWGRPGLLIDVRAGAAEGFSLEGLQNVHFVTLTPPSGESPTVPPRPA
jgi:hypothetical protein